MISIQKNPEAEAVNQAAKHVLFVEGSNESIDPTILKNLLEDYPINVQALGKSSGIKNTAESLFEYHKTYYFLIDRDHHDDKKVNNSWKNFPDSSAYNLLIWKRREIENYFIDPDYLCNSEFIKVSKTDLKKEILRIVNERLFLDIANYVIISIRESMKQKWIKKFQNPNAFPDRQTSLEKLISAPEFNEINNRVKDKISATAIEKEFDKFHKLLSNKNNKVQFGTGQWMNLIQGKKVFSQIANSQCFKVKNRQGRLLEGADKSNEIVEQLLKLDDKYQPKDFVELKKLIKKIMDK